MCEFVSSCKKCHGWLANKGACTLEIYRPLVTVGGGLCYLIFNIFFFLHLYVCHNICGLEYVQVSVRLSKHAASYQNLTTFRLRTAF